MRSIPKRTLDNDQPLTPIRGNPPSLIDLPPGCAFSERCPYARERCLVDEPIMQRIGDEHYSACFYSQESEFLLNSPIHDTEEDLPPVGALDTGDLAVGEAGELDD
jgi:oligopeptide transport system ATP-binding protein